MGGVGKTQTAVEYAYRYREAYDWVFWVKADTDLNLATNFGKIASAIGLPQIVGQPLDETVQAVKRWLETNDRWLLIFDNADTPAWLKLYRPNNPNGRILITSRAQVFDSLDLAQPLEVKKLDQKEAVDFLYKRTERSQAQSAEVAVAEELAKELDYLPLALEQAGAYLLQKKASFSAYLVSYRKQPVPTLQKQLPQTGDYPESVATTWAMNFQEVEQTAPAAADLLSLNTFLAPDDIPYELLVHGAAYLGDQLSNALADAADDPLLLPELLEPLTRYSLIRIEPEQNCYSIHRMVQAVLRDRMDATTRQQWVERSVEALNAAFPTVEFQTWQECDRLLTHVQAIVQHLKQHHYNSVSLARLLNQTGYYLSEQGRYSEAELLITKAFTIVKQQLIGDHLAVAQSLNNLAELYASQRRYLETRPLYIRAVVILKRRLGSDQLYLAIVLNNLAHLYAFQKRYSKAESLYTRALDIQKRHLAEDHPDIATSLNNLAGIYRAQGRYAKAELLYKRSLEIRERQLEADPLGVAQSLNNLAELYRMQGRYAEAEPLYLRALALLFQCLRNDHPNMQAVWQNFQRFLQAVMQAGETSQLSDHPVTQDLLRQMKEGSGE